MRPTPWEKAEPYRYNVFHPDFPVTVFGDPAGCFEIPGPSGKMLRCIVSRGDLVDDITWDHVSVSTKSRTPNWAEMCFAKRVFWGDEETVMQLHPPQKDWVNCHPYCLHLWKPTHCEIPLPPSIMVGPDEFKQFPDEGHKK